MPILDKNDINQVQKYNKFLQDNNASAMQSLNWGSVKSNWIQEAIYIEENNEIIAVMTILLNKVPVFNSYMMYASRGPVCDINNIDIVKKLIKEANIIAKKYKAFVLKFDPEFKSNEKVKKLYLDNGFNVVQGSNVIQPRHNMVLNIANETEENLMKRFAEKTRYNIRVAIKKGVNVRYSRREEDLKIFYNLYVETTIRDKIGCRPYEYFKRMLDTYDENQLRIYIAEHEEIPLSSAIALNYGGKMFYIYGASSNEKRNLMPNYLMQWEMIKWGLENKCNNYDFGGVFEFTNENGLYKFKSGFCKQEGVTEYIGEIDKVYNPVIYFAYTNLAPKFQKIKRKFKRI
ncbi:MAG: peptidoglycan bridge formation glycyltransferase FemA/FemB family protein [Clostridia bacterium]